MYLFFQEAIRQRRPGLRRRRPGAQAAIRKRPYFEDASNINFGEYDNLGYNNNRRVSNVEPDVNYRGPGINKIPGRIQTLNPYATRSGGAGGDGLTAASFGGGFQRRPAPNSRPGSIDCDFYTDSLCLEVSQYPREEIVTLLSVNRRVGADLIADVVDQSADNLIDGVTAGTF
jgi:hypothetical protein